MGVYRCRSRVSFSFFFISGGRGIGMANNTKAYFFLSFLVITFILTRVIKQENSYSQVDFFKFKPIFLVRLCYHYVGHVI